MLLAMTLMIDNANQIYTVNYWQNNIRSNKEVFGIALIANTHMHTCRIWKFTPPTQRIIRHQGLIVISPSERLPAQCSILLSELSDLKTSFSASAHNNSSLLWKVIVWLDTLESLNVWPIIIILLAYSYLCNNKIQHSCTCNWNQSLLSN